MWGGAVSADDWPQWRGPNRDGISTETGWTTDWPKEGPPKLWETEIGKGYSTVAVVAGRIYTTGDKTLCCLNAETGEVVWKDACGPSHATPTVNSDKVYSLNKNGVLTCHEAGSGKLVWRMDPQNDLGATRSGQYGFGASSVVVDDMVMVPVRVNGGALFAFDKKTGKVVWKAFHRGNRSYGFWSTPVLSTIDGKRAIIWMPGHHIVALNPASGETLWKYEYPEDKFDRVTGGANAATPAVSGNRILAHHHPQHPRKGETEKTFCIEVTDGVPKLVWETTSDFISWFHSPVILNGYAYGGRQRGFRCYDLKTGEVRWSARAILTDGKLHKPTPGGNRGRRSRARRFRPAQSFTAVDGKLITWGWGKQLAVLEVSPEGYKVLTFADFPDRGKWVVPVLANGRLYIRTEKGTLICLDVRKK